MTPALAPEKRTIELALRAKLNEEYGRTLRLGSLRWLAAASVPVWLQALWGLFPDLVAFWALLAQGAGLGIVVAFAVLERRWRRRAVQLEGTPSAPVVHAPWSVRDEVRLALWHALAVVSLVPWSYVAFGRPFPRPLLSATLAAGVAVFLLLVVAETLPRLGPRRRTR